METLSDKKKSTFEDIEYLRNNDNVNFYYEDDIKQFVKDLKEMIEKTVNEDKKTKAQWIYKRIIDKLSYKIDKLAGEKLL